jgi:hypothetical protein
MVRAPQNTLIITVNYCSLIGTLYRGVPILTLFSIHLRSNIRRALVHFIPEYAELWWLGLVVNKSRPRIATVKSHTVTLPHLWAPSRPEIILVSPQGLGPSRQEVWRHPNAVELKQINMVQDMTKNMSGYPFDFWTCVSLSDCRFSCC